MGTERGFMRPCVDRVPSDGGGMPTRRSAGRQVEPLVAPGGLEGRARAAGPPAPPMVNQTARLARHRPPSFLPMTPATHLSSAPLRPLPPPFQTPRSWHTRRGWALSASRSTGRREAGDASRTPGMSSGAPPETFLLPTRARGDRPSRVDGVTPARRGRCRGVCATAIRGSAACARRRGGGALPSRGRRHGGFPA